MDIDTDQVYFLETVISHAWDQLLTPVSPASTEVLVYQDHNNQVEEDAEMAPACPHLHCHQDYLVASCHGHHHQAYQSAT